MGKMFIFSGQSSSGKDSIFSRILKDKELGLQTVTLHTTRPPRVGEVDGREYHFCDEKKMDQLRDAGKIIEHRSYNTDKGVWHYFTADIGIHLDRYNYATLNTLEGIKQFQQFYTKEQLVSFLIQVNDGIRLSRALERERMQRDPNYRELCRRFLSDGDDFSEENIAQSQITHVVTNDGYLSDTITEVKRLIKTYM